MDRNKTLNMMVENYHSQVEIVGGYTDVSLYDYLKGIGLKDNEIIYALNYNEKRIKSKEELYQNEIIKLTAIMIRGWK